ncbi:MAG: glycosyltransferase family 4 protein [Planctomycetes bacterium]|nr:glycosyltransferase family 4 protein [Planctomycetota bacterium]
MANYPSLKTGPRMLTSKRNMNLRVLYLTMNPNTISTTAPMMGWLTHLRAQGLEPVVAHNTLGDFHRWLCDRDIPSHHVPMPVPDKLRPWPFIKSILALRRIIRQHHIDLVHCNEQNIYLHGNAAARWTRRPVVVSIHAAMERGYCKWVFGGKRRPLRMYFVSKACREFNRPSLEGVVPEERWNVLSNGLEPDEFKPDPTLRTAFRAAHKLDGKIALGVACAIRPGKQIEHLIDAGTRVTDPRVRIVLAGSAIAGEESYGETILAAARKKLGDRFVYVGHLKDVKPFFAGLDLFVNTSKQEAGSISVLQSLASGCPVVGYSSKSVEEQILPGGGEIVEQDSVEQLAAALGRWLADPAALGKARESARRRFMEAYDIRALSMHLWNEYLRIVPEAKDRP